MGEAIWIERHKWPDRPHYRWPMVPVGEDEHGLWLRMHPDGPILKGDGIPTSARRDGLRLVSWTEPWCAWFPTRVGSPHPPEQTWRLYIDIIDQAVRREDGTITMVDLDLDVVQYLDGRVELLDEDEFVEHQVRYGYPPEIVALAESAARSVLDAVRRKRTALRRHRRRHLGCPRRHRPRRRVQTGSHRPEISRLSGEIRDGTARSPRAGPDCSGRLG